MAQPFINFQFVEVYMHSLKLLLVATALTSSVAVADGDAAVFRDGALKIPAVVNLDGDQVEYYADVTVEQLNGLDFRLLGAVPRTLATIDAMSVTVMQTLPVTATLELAGVFSDPCVTLEPVSVTREDNTFHVVVAEAPPNPAALCLAAVVPFEKSVPLDVTGLTAGNYRVLVNGKLLEFELE